MRRWCNSRAPPIQPLAHDHDAGLFRRHGLVAPSDIGVPVHAPGAIGEWCRQVGRTAEPLTDRLGPADQPIHGGHELRGVGQVVADPAGQFIIPPVEPRAALSTPTAAEPGPPACDVALIGEVEVDPCPRLSTLQPHAADLARTFPADQIARLSSKDRACWEMLVSRPPSRPE